MIDRRHKPSFFAYNKNVKIQKSQYLLLKVNIDM